MEASAYHGVRAVSTAGVQLLTTQRDLIYTAHAETRVRNLGRNKTALGLTVSRLVEEGGPPTKARARAWLAAAPAGRMDISLHRAALLVMGSFARGSWRLFFRAIVYSWLRWPAEIGNHA